MPKKFHNEGIIVHGGNVQIGTAAFGSHSTAISISAEQPDTAVVPETPPASPRHESGDSLESGVREWDAFISHASEDKRTFVAPLARALTQRGLKIWYDDFTLTVGSSLRESIDFGLLRSRYGIVVLSPNFFAKDWTHQEVNGLMSREIGGVRVILPVWHNVTQEQVQGFSPILADRVAARSSEGLGTVVDKLTRAITASR